MLLGLAAQAANIKRPNNSIYTDMDFLDMYPQFANILPEPAIEMFLELANACVSEERFGKSWKYACGLFVAHLATLYVQNKAEAGTPEADIIAAAQNVGAVTSESADGVSYSMDTSIITSDLSGWGAWKLTAYGVQFASLARVFGKGGMYVW